MKVKLHMLEAGTMDHLCSVEGVSVVPTVGNSVLLSVAPHGGQQQSRFVITSIDWEFWVDGSETEVAIIVEVTPKGET